MALEIKLKGEEKNKRNLFTLKDRRLTRYIVTDGTLKIFFEFTQRNGVKITRDNSIMSSRGRTDRHFNLKLMKNYHKEHQ